STPARPTISPRRSCAGRRPTRWTRGTSRSSPPRCARPRGPRRPRSTMRCGSGWSRDGLLAMRTQARNQRHALLQWPVVVVAVRQHLDELIADLDRRIAALEAEIAAVLEERAWAESLACLTSAPGIGLVTASWLLVGTLNFARC